MRIQSVNRVFVISVAWLACIALAFHTGREDAYSVGDTTELDFDAAGDVELLNELEKQIASAKKWFAEQELATTAEGRPKERTRRDPHDLLHHFGFTHAQSKLLANAARALQNVSGIYRRVFSELSPEGKRQLCEAAGYELTTDDCPSSTKYRTIDGTCNNLINVNWGKAFSPFVRILPAAYANDSAALRLAKSGNPLPGARDVSMKLIENENNVKAEPWTVLIMHLGQFLDHDIDHAALQKVNCTCETTDKCLPIAIPEDDPFFEQPCLRFARSVPVPDANCNIVPRQQVNQITSFIDLSQVYGSTLEKAMEMRDVSQGKGLLLAMDDPSNSVGKELLPNDEEHTDCVFANPLLKCGLAGDVRAAEQPGLTSIHTILLRQHNRIAKRLSELNPDWDDETYYNEARRICIAMWQHVVYNEYLPPLMGSQNMAKHGLRVHPDTFFYGYDPYLNPGVFNVFAAAAYRVGHTQVPSTLLKLDRDHNVMEQVSLSEAFFNATYMNTSHGQGGLEAFIRGMVAQAVPKVDLSMTNHLTKHMFADPPGGEGLDLAALNIQRGRDHGIAAYNDWRVHCGLPRASSFDDLKDHMTETTVQKFRDAYDDVDDIDLFPALIGEETGDGQLMGPTLACLVGEQFHALKFGDRFWYEDGVGDQAFTKDQLTEIRKATFARLFCDNMNDLPTIQPYVYMEPDVGTVPSDSTNSFYEYSKANDFPNSNGAMPGFFNGRVSCSDTATIPQPSVEPWKEGYVESDGASGGKDLPFSLRQEHVIWYRLQDQS
ncbi:peroxidasin homolog [Acanthaster planci]|uniref:Peroxidasin homolog n=1 Tax=Acanthaster planci TaxID=133434 RepID=A0A8B7Y1J4_ACAPL|nr:peroxidasin homolog [Acanthaster planci]